MIDLGTLKIGITVDNKEATSQLKKTGEEVENTGGKFSKFKKSSLKAVAGVTAVATGVVLATKKIKNLADTTAKYGDEVDKNSQKMGISSKGYQEWGYILERNGANINTLKKGMMSLQTAMDSNNEAFGELGVKIKDANGNFRDTEAVMNDSITALAKVKNETERTTLATELFGKRTAQELAPTLNSGAKGINELKERAEELGLVMSEKGVKASAEYEDAMTDINNTTQGLRNNLMSNVLPTISKFTFKMSDAIGKLSGKIFKANGNPIKIAEAIITWIGEGIAKAIQALPKLLGKLIKGLTQLMSDATKALGNGNGKLTAKITQILGDLVQTIINNLPQFVVCAVKLIGALVKGIVKATPQVIKALVSLIGKMFKSLVGKKGTILNAGVTLFKAFAKGIKSMFTTILKLPIELINGIVNKIKGALSTIKSAGKSIFSALWEGLKEKWTQIKNWFSDKINWIKDKVLFWKDNKDKVDGSHRTGLNEVPYDGYVAELHKGEMILTQAEARRYKDNPYGTSGSNKIITVNFNGKYNFRDKEDIDYFMSEAQRLSERRLATC